MQLWRHLWTASECSEAAGTSRLTVIISHRVDKEMPSINANENSWAWAGNAQCNREVEDRLEACGLMELRHCTSRWRPCWSIQKRLYLSLLRHGGRRWYRDWWSPDTEQKRGYFYTRIPKCKGNMVEARSNFLAVSTLWGFKISLGQQLASSLHMDKQKRLRSPPSAHDSSTIGLLARS